MRLIDADALVYKLTEMVRHSTGEYKHGIDAARLVVMEAPTLAHGTGSIMIKWTPDLDKLVRDVAVRGLNDFSFLGKSIMEWVEIILEQPNWISVKDKLPEEDGTMRGYLVAVGNWVGIMPFFNGAFREGLYGKESDYPVHHWMPIPEPPKEDTDGDPD